MLLQGCYKVVAALPLVSITSRLTACNRDYLATTLLQPVACYKVMCIIYYCKCSDVTYQSQQPLGLYSISFCTWGYSMMKSFFSASPLYSVCKAYSVPSSTLKSSDLIVLLEPVKVTFLASSHGMRHGDGTL